MLISVLDSVHYCEKDPCAVVIIELLEVRAGGQE